MIKANGSRCGAEKKKARKDVGRRGYSGTSSSHSNKPPNALSLRNPVCLVAFKKSRTQPNTRADGPTKSLR